MTAFAAFFQSRIMPPTPDSPAGDKDPKDYFAAERTLLAWVRTGLAMMGFGFVVARFGLFLREIAAARGRPLAPQQGLSLWFGTAMVALGVVVSFVAAYRHMRNVARLRRGEPLRFAPVSLGAVVATALGLIGAAMAVYLLVVAS